MNLTDEEAVRIYAAARSGLHRAAHQIETDLLDADPETKGRIAVRVTASAGRAAFEESLKIASAHQENSHAE